MGEVYRAFDLKLRVDVALKAVRPDRTRASRGRERLRREVRAAREVVSPNVCRIFDLVDEDGQELVSMEYIDGQTLAETLRQHGPLELREAREIAAQFLSGLESIHRAGLVHCDFKPENVMLTRAGRVVVMDFGLAQLASTAQPGTLAGTAGYMAPEQARGEPIDARADVFAAGVVLTEMLTVRGGCEGRQELWRAVREAPPRVPDGPWAPVLRQCLSPIAEERPASARALARALEELTLRLPAFEEKRPYPGLASFSEEDAGFFHGREPEIEAFLHKLQHPRLLALVGPSGAGKSSFLRAGLLPKLRGTWGAVVVTPAARPFQALARALLPHFAGDEDAADALLRFEETDVAVSLFSRWRRRYERGLLVVDQFEELFTQSPPTAQSAFAGLLGRLVLEADTCVVLSLRDDFLFRCHAHEPLAPAFHDLTPLGPVSASGLRRALVQPALSCGYRFEDEALVDEMVEAVQGERGALPLLAFATSRLWDLRDRERGLLTREAYQRIGGVAGALAQHAEAAVDRIGSPRTPLVRELFRNLVTADATRAVRDREELLSVFGPHPDAHGGARQANGAAAPFANLVGATGQVRSREDAQEVLGALVDARLLTVYEGADERGAGRQQVEVVHESLLSAWPRLVRWQTQDQDGAQLRDQLRQAAQAWHERGRPHDLLWTGSAYRDFAVWRERYGGRLTEREQEFVRAATSLDGRRRRRRRLAVAAALAAIGAVALITSILWQRSEVARRHAEAQARQREAAELLALGRLRLEDHPSAALAHAIASLERVDNDPARRFAVEALWQGPTEFVFAPEGAAPGVSFSRDGRFLAHGTQRGARLHGQEGGESRELDSDQPFPHVAFGGASDLVVTRAQAGGPARVFRTADAREVRQLPLGPRQHWVLRADAILTFDGDGSAPASGSSLVLAWPLSGEPPRARGVWNARGATSIVVGPDGSWVAAARQGRLVLQKMHSAGARHVRARDQDVSSVWVSPRHGKLATVEERGRAARVWSTAGAEPVLLRELRSPAQEAIENLALDPSGRYVSARTKGDRLMHRIWDLDGPPDLEPLTLRDRDAEGWIMGRDFDPQGRWLAVAHNKYASLWALHEKRPRVLKGLLPPFFTALAFSPDGRFLVSGSYGGEIWRYSIDPRGAPRLRLFHQPNGWLGVFPAAFDPRGRYLVVGTQISRTLLVVPIDGTPAQVVDVGLRPGSVDLRRDGRLLAAAVAERPAGQAGVMLRDLPSGRTRWLTSGVSSDGCMAGGAPGPVEDLRFLPDGRLLTLGPGGLLLFEADAGNGARLLPCRPPGIPDDFSRLRVTSDGDRVLIAHMSWNTSRVSELTLLDLATRVERSVDTHGRHVTAVAIDPADRLLVTGSGDGLVRVGPLSGTGEPHLLYGHGALVTGLAISPDGRWIASAAEDGAIRLWPMPEGRPLHTLPYEELLRKLRALTNLRVVHDAGSTTGYKVQPGPFPGWATAPTW